MDVNEMQRLFEEGKIIKLPVERKGKTKSSDLILVLLQKEAKTAKEIATELKLSKNGVYNTLRNLERKGKLVAFARGKEVYYVSSTAV